MSPLPSEQRSPQQHEDFTSPYQPQRHIQIFKMLHLGEIWTLIILGYFINALYVLFQKGWDGFVNYFTQWQFLTPLAAISPLLYWFVLAIIGGVAFFSLYASLAIRQDDRKYKAYEAQQKAKQKRLADETAEEAKARHVAGEKRHRALFDEVDKLKGEVIYAPPSKQPSKEPFFYPSLPGGPAAPLSEQEWLPYREQYLAQLLKSEALSQIQLFVGQQNYRIEFDRLFWPLSLQRDQQGKGIDAASDLLSVERLLQIFPWLNLKMFARFRPAVLLNAVRQFVPAKSRYTVMDAYAQSQMKRMVISGGPGVGKTTMLNFMLRHLAQQAQHTTTYGLPLAVNLQGFAQSDMAFRDYLHLVIRKNVLLMHADAVTAVKLESYLDNQSLILGLDGFDELDTAHRGWVVAFLSSYAGSWIVCSRTTGRDFDQLEPNRVSKWVISPLDDDARKHLAQHIFSALGQIQGTPLASQNTAISFIKNITQESKLLSWAENPFLFSLAAVLYNVRSSLPHSRSELYRDVLDAVLLHRNDRNHDAIVAMNTELAKYAYWLFISLQRRTFTNEDLTTYLNETTLAGGKKQGQLRQLILESGVIEVLDSQMPLYGFRHQSFQEYFVALHIVKLSLATDATSHEIAERALQEHHFNPQWIEIFRLFFGIASLNYGVPGETIARKWLEEQLASYAANGFDPGLISLTLVLTALAEITTPADSLEGNASSRGGQIQVQFAPEACHIWAQGLVATAQQQRPIRQRRYLDMATQIAALTPSTEVITSLGPLFGALKSDQPIVRKAAAKAFGILGEGGFLQRLDELNRADEMIDPLLAALANSNDTEVQQGILLALGSLGKHTPVDGILAALKTDDLLIRISVMTLRDGNVRGIVATIVGPIGKPSPGTEDQAQSSGSTRILGNLGSVLSTLNTIKTVDDSFIELLIADLQQQQNNDKRATAAFVLFGLGLREPLERSSLLIPLLDASTHGDFMVRLGATLALSVLGSYTPYSKLRELAEQENDELISLAALFGWATGKDPIPLETIQKKLAKYFGEQNYPLYIAAATTLLQSTQTFLRAALVDGSDADHQPLNDMVQLGGNFLLWLMKGISGIQQQLSLPDLEGQLQTGDPLQQFLAAFTLGSSRSVHQVMTKSVPETWMGDVLTYIAWMSGAVVARGWHAPLDVVAEMANSDHAETRAISVMIQGILGILQLRTIEATTTMLDHARQDDHEYVRAAALLVETMMRQFTTSNENELQQHATEELLKSGQVSRIVAVGTLCWLALQHELAPTPQMLLGFDNALHDEDEWRRALAALTLGIVDVAEAAPMLQASLRDDTSELAQSCKLLALGMLNSSDFAAFADMDALSPDIRGTALIALGLRPHAERVRILTSWLTAESADDRSAALVALALIGEGLPIDQIEDRLVHDEQVRIFAAFALCAAHRQDRILAHPEISLVGQDGAWGDLQTGTVDEAIRGIQGLTFVKLTSALLKRFSFDDAIHRIPLPFPFLQSLPNVLSSLQSLAILTGDEIPLTPMLDLLDDEDETIQSEAQLGLALLSGLRALGNSLTTESVETLLTSDKEAMRAVGILLLTGTPPTEAKQRAYALLADTTTSLWLRVAAALVLGMMGETVDAQLFAKAPQLEQLALTFAMSIGAFQNGGSEALSRFFDAQLRAKDPLTQIIAATVAATINKLGVLLGLIETGFRVIYRPKVVGRDLIGVGVGFFVSLFLGPLLPLLAIPTLFVDPILGLLLLVLSLAFGFFLPLLITVLMLVFVGNSVYSMLRAQPLEFNLVPNAVLFYLNKGATYLEKTGMHLALPPLLNIATNVDTQGYYRGIALSLIASLAIFGHADGYERVAELLHDPDELIQESALIALGVWSETCPIQSLQELMKDERTRNIVAAYVFSGRSYTKAAAFQMIQRFSTGLSQPESQADLWRLLLRNDSTPSLLALRLLAQDPHEESLPALLKALAHHNAEVRRAACDIMATLPKVATKNALEADWQSATGKQWYERAAILTALARIDDHLTMSLFQEAVQDADWRVQVVALDQFREQASQMRFDRLLSLMGAKQRELRAAAARALAVQGSSEAIHALMALWQESSQGETFTLLAAETTELRTVLRSANVLLGLLSEPVDAKKSIRDVVLWFLTINASAGQPTVKVNKDIDAAADVLSEAILSGAFELLTEISDFLEEVARALESREEGSQPNTDAATSEDTLESLKDLLGKAQVRSEALFSDVMKPGRDAPPSDASATEQPVTEQPASEAEPSAEEAKESPEAAHSWNNTDALTLWHQVRASADIELVVDDLFEKFVRLIDHPLLDQVTNVVAQFRQGSQQLPFGMILLFVEWSLREVFEGAKSDWRTRVAALEGFGQQHQPRAIEPLIAALQSDEQNRVRLAAVQALGGFKGAKARRALHDAVLRDGAATVRCAILKTLLFHKMPLPLKSLLVLLTDVDSDVRLQAVDFCKSVHGRKRKQIVHYLRRMALTDLSSRVRQNALVTLCHYGVSFRDAQQSDDNSTIAIFLNALGDIDSTVREAAVQALHRLGRRVPLNRITSLAHGDDYGKRHAAIEILGMRKSHQSRVVLEQILATSEGALRGVAITALHQFHAAKDAALFTPYLKDSDVRVRVAATSALVARTPVMISTFAIASKDTEWQVREAALLALCQAAKVAPEMLQPPHVDSILHGVLDASKEVRLATVKVLVRLKIPISDATVMALLCDEAPSVAYEALTLLAANPSLKQKLEAQALIGLVDEQWNTFLAVATRHTLAEKVEKIGKTSEAFVTLLTESARDSKFWQLQSRAIRALGKVKRRVPDEAVQLLLQLHADPTLQEAIHTEIEETLDSIVTLETGINET